VGHCSRGYIAGVAALVAAGVLLQSPGPFLVAVLVTLPSSIVAMPVYYLLYGVVAYLSGGNPSSSSGTGTSAPDGTTVTVVTGEPALWFTVAVGVLAVLVMACAAWANAMGLKVIRSRRHSERVADRPL
jgi:hypothetical protein